MTALHQRRAVGETAATSREMERVLFRFAHPVERSNEALPPTLVDAFVRRPDLVWDSALRHRVLLAVAARAASALGSDSVPPEIRREADALITRRSLIADEQARLAADVPGLSQRCLLIKGDSVQRFYASTARQYVDTDVVLGTEEDVWTFAHWLTESGYAMAFCGWAYLETPPHGMPRFIFQYKRLDGPLSEEEACFELLQGQIPLTPRIYFDLLPTWEAAVSRSTSSSDYFLYCSATESILILAAETWDRGGQLMVRDAIDLSVLLRRVALQGTIEQLFERAYEERVLLRLLWLLDYLKTLEPEGIGALVDGPRNSVIERARRYRHLSSHPILACSFPPSSALLRQLPRALAEHSADRRLGHPIVRRATASRPLLISQLHRRQRCVRLVYFDQRRSAARCLRVGRGHEVGFATPIGSFVLTHSSVLSPAFWRRIRTSFSEPG